MDVQPGTGTVPAPDGGNRGTGTLLSGVLGGDPASPGLVENTRPRRCRAREEFIAAAARGACWI